MPPRPGVENSVQIASCGADKSIIFRDISSDHKGGLEFTRGNHIVGKTTLYDMETDVSKPTPGILFFLPPVFSSNKGLGVSGFLNSI